MDNKKERIIRAAIDVFKEKGIEKTKVSDIVKSAGIAQGTFYLYFPSKLAVMPSIAEEMVDRIIVAIKENVQKEDSFSDQLTQLIDVVFKVTDDYHEILALIYAGLASSEHLKEWETIYKPFYSWMSTFLEGAKNNGSIRESIHPDRTAKLLIGLIESAAEQIYLYDHSNDQIVHTQKQELIDFLSHALGTQN
ncbi:MULTISPECIES: TetR family transcriptional regulator [Bacillus]|uniref:TetR family transcriptional regulator n=1 Tax=Bacillus TaxID=1386 RepID=UPI0002F822A8|nr:MULTISPECIES: TetR family transcriptional regulator [Bacillus]